jgi:hypothetical protein
MTPSDVTRLQRIADDLDAYARDEGGFSAETRAAIHADADFLRSLTADVRWEDWARHQEWCSSCAEAHPRDCSDGAVLWAACHPEDEEAAKILAERTP